LKTAKEVLKEIDEQKKYPSQYDAEIYAEWFDFVNGLSFGGVSPEVKDAFDKANKIRMSLHDKIFGDKSPWAMKRAGSKVKVVWDKNKAKNLGLD